MGIKRNSEKLINDSIIQDIRDSLDGLEYGSIIITVHNRKITQIEKSRKQRFDDVWKTEKGGGI